MGKILLDMLSTVFYYIVRPTKGWLKKIDFFENSYSTGKHERIRKTMDVSMFTNIKYLIAILHIYLFHDRGLYHP